MIRVNERAEPEGFDNDVRKPGRKFLRGVPQPTKAEWDAHSFWRRCLQQLHVQYGGVCAYTCHWIAFDTGAKTVEHFRPKSTCPQQAYEWSNYRLVCLLLNARKRVDERILDPFAVQNGWFIIEFPSLLVKPAPNLSRALTQQITHTRDKLKLNDESTCLKQRARYVERYCKRRITFEHLQEEAPFLAMEMQRQGLVDTINDMMGYNGDDPDMIY